MKNWTIGKRLTLGFAIIMAVMVCLGTLTWYQMADIKKNLDLVTKESLPALKITDDIRYQLALLRITNLKHAVYNDAAQKTELDKQAREEEAGLAGFVGQYEQYAKTPDQKALFAKVGPLLTAYKAEAVKLREASTQKKPDEVQAFLASAGKIGNEFIQAVDALGKRNSQATETGAKAIEQSASSAKMAVMVFNLVAIALGTGIALLIIRGISGILRRLVRELDAGAEQTTSAAGNVSAASQSLAEGASEQAASIQETSASLEELSSMTQRNSDHSQKANGLAKQAREAAERGAVDMQSMSAAMEAIKVSSDDIAKIIKTIDEIAFQTNILALNAAVEAARAGEAGMGFAVVADEVRALAQRSAQAAKETSAKIEGAIARTSQGVEISAKVAKTLADIVGRARQVDELVTEVASASREQTQGIAQINIAVGQMDKVIQANAATAEESAAAAEELNAQAENMKSSVAELLRLVGAKRAGAEGMATRPADARRRTTHRTAVSASHAAAAGQEHRFSQRQPRSQPDAEAELATASAVARARSAIPLEGDFQNF
jgi:methyl-accepting chemotaxis protein